MISTCDEGLIVDGNEIGMGVAKRALGRNRQYLNTANRSTAFAY